ncbi:MAG: epoxyqueuosine reductase [Mariniphaga sp.]|nr:epoxyqueuosine reductase [Mariniphaga sp.]
MSLEAKLKTELIEHGADFVYFVNVSQLSKEQNKGYPNAILLGIALSPGYLQEITNTQEYVRNMIRNNQTNNDEFHLKEIKTDRMADYISNSLKSKGFSAYSQSEDNIELTGFYDKEKKSTPLPHKTIALLAGLGWIGKHNLLVTPKYGSAISMCTVLTDAPLETVLYTPKESQCGNCKICINLCPTNALKGNSWNTSTSRDELIDVKKCNTCIKCLVLCPWTQAYMKKYIQKQNPLNNPD